MEKIFKGLKNEKVEIKIFRKIIKIKHNLKINFLFTLHSQYSCYDLCVLLAHLKGICSELEIVKIENWVNENCEYLKLDENKIDEGNQFSLF